MSALLLAHLLAVLVLAACPRLHHWVHPDADNDDHDCVVVWLLHGGGDPVAGSTVALAVADVCVAARFPAWPEHFVPSVFAAHGVFEHAPPSARNR